MRARTLLLVVLLGVALPAAASTSLADAWLRVQEELSGTMPGALEERIQALQQAAREVDARRLTPYASALVTWALDHPGESGRAVVRYARRLDPQLPAASFLLAGWSWDEHSYYRAVVEYMTGWIQVFGTRESRRLALAAGALWLVFSVGLTAMVVVLLQVALRLRQMAHDSMELGLLLFNRGNAFVFAAVLLLLPVFAALGPLWLVAYLFALGWPYLSRPQLTAAVALSVILALVGPALESWQELALRVPPVTSRVEDMLAERRIDPSTLRELADLESDMQDLARYELILGELLRMHGDPAAASVAFQRAVVADPRDAQPHVFLGNLAMEDGDVQRAVQHYTAATTLDERSAFAYHNLSFAYDQSYRFKEGDEAREKARELAGQRMSTLGVSSSNPRIRYPRLGKTDVDVLLSGVTPRMRLSAALGTPGLKPLSLFLSPLSAVFWVTGLIGAAMVVARSRRGWKATSCARCGKVFCPRCKTSTESASYCSQCISVFLKRDMVSIEQQTAKLAQIRRWETWKTLLRRAVGTVVPGGEAILDGRPWPGLGVGLLGWSCLLGALVFVPRFVPAVDPLAAAMPLQLVLYSAVAVLWGRSAFIAWR